MRVFHSVVIREKPPSKRPRKQSRQWICFLRMHDVCLDKYQDMAGIFVMEVKTYRKKERRFAFVDISNGRGWGNSRPVSLSLSGCSKQCLSSRS